MLDNVVSHELSFGALGLPWMLWNLVYMVLALFAGGAIFVFVVLVGTRDRAGSEEQTWLRPAAVQSARPTKRFCPSCPDE